MPEGDSIRRVASALGPVLVGATLTSIVIAGVTRDELADQRVDAITPLGKHMTIALAGGWTIRVHLGMNGRWRRFRSGGGEPPPSASLILRTTTDAFACLRAKTVELLARRDPRHGRALASLGPDVLADDFAPATAADRALARGGEIGQLLLDQRVAAGIGNIYKCESLFVEKTSPFADVRTLPLAQVTALYATAARLMRANLNPGMRRTRVGFRVGRLDRFHVYRRVGQPCERCGTRIQTAVQGVDAPRTTYFCPHCQPTPAGVVPRTRRRR
ncbi:MAG TPA: zinc finger domain-containing protein [Kofleriaceae bacterium]|nr:zinc finger domain-containing protein [Kofleriaceae bacterium]